MKNLVAHTLVAVAILTGFAAPTMEPVTAHADTAVAVSTVAVPSSYAAIGVLGQ